MKHFTDIMIDIETLGNVRGCVVTQIGLAAFCRGSDTASMPRFRVNLDIDAQVSAGFTLSGDTVKWWMRQSDAARMSWASEEASMAAKLPSEAMQAVKDWINAHGAKGFLVWANSPSFDCVILDALWERTRVRKPWAYWQEADCRTLKLIAPGVKKPEPEVDHDASSDAAAQALYVRRVFADLSGPGGSQSGGGPLNPPGPLATAGEGNDTLDNAAGQ